jgi:hypothetical protein
MFITVAVLRSSLVGREQEAKQSVYVAGPAGQRFQYGSGGRGGLAVSRRRRHQHQAPQ